MNDFTMTNENQNQPSSRHKEVQDFFRQLDIQLLVHELKGPLSVIENNNRMLLEWQNKYGQLSEFQERALKRCLRCTAKIDNIAQSILEVGSSHTGRFNLSKFNVVHFATEILVTLLETESFKPIGDPHGGKSDIDQRNAYLSSNGIFLDISTEVKELVLYQDEAKLSHILNNLVRNALQHKKFRIIVHMAIKRPNLEICVHDDGNGIVPENQPELFKCDPRIRANKRDRRTKRHGLGLASSRILARRLGGDITVDTQCRSGSRFVLIVPLSMDESTLI